jgi:ABC-type oligopeptide transport system substrate-binding subunit
VHASFTLPDPSIWLHLVLPHTTSGWFRRLMTQAMGLTNDPVTRMSAYSREENWAIQQGLIIPLASGNYGYVIKSQVQGLQVTPLGVVPNNNNWSAVSVS